MDQPIPVTVVGGYLGSGKTTLINHLLRNANGIRLAIMVNDFGDLPIDEDLIEASSDEIISLAGGCVCCSFGGDLVEAMTSLSRLNVKPDHVLLETSGVALPGAVASTLSLLSGFTLEGVLVLADAETVRTLAADRFMGDTVERQLSDADLVLVNKTDLVSQAALLQLRRWLSVIAPKAQIIDTERSVIPPDVVLQDIAHDMSAELDGTYQHDALFESRIVNGDGCADVAGFAKALIADNPRIIRAKGFVRNAGGVMKTVQIVGKRLEVSNAPHGVVTGVVVILTSSGPN